MAAKLYTMRTALSRVFDEIFQKIFSPHNANNPKTRRTFVFHRARQKQAILNCRLFAFPLKMVLNLILKLNLKIISDLKIDFESDFESENVSRET